MQIQNINTYMKVFADKLGYDQRKFVNFNKLWFPWKPVDVQLSTIPENARIGDCYQCVKFYACIKKCTIGLKFQVTSPDVLVCARIIRLFALSTVLTFNSNLKL